jgi:hypothetical protein
MEYSIGNSKIGKDTIIVNLGSAKNCHSGISGQCDLWQSKACYAFQAELQYPNVLPYRERQATFWKESSLIEKLESFEKAFKKHKKIKFVRYNESGDIYSYNDIATMVTIANNFQSITFYTYTHNKLALQAYLSEFSLESIPKNLVINTSDFTMQGFNSFKIDRTFKLNKKRTITYTDYKAYKKNLDSKALVCIGDCSKCSLCKVSHAKTINVPLH